MPPMPTQGMLIFRWREHPVVVSLAEKKRGCDIPTRGGQWLTTCSYRKKPVLFVMASVANTYSHCNQFRADAACVSEVISRFHIHSVRSFAYSEGEPDPSIKPQSARIRVHLGQVCYNDSIGAVISPPLPSGNTTNRGTGWNWTREAYGTVIPAWTAYKISSETFSSQLKSIVCGQGEEIAVPTDAPGLQCSANRSEGFVVRIQPIPHELADERIASVKVVADTGTDSPPKGCVLSHRIQGCA